jgi:glucose-1-phosphate thymidylyltransferase
LKGVILAAGLGTRLRPLSLTRPKPLLPVANKHIISYIIEDIASAGIKDIAVVISHEKELIEHELRSLYPDLNLTFIVQKILNGIGGAVALAKDFVNGDSFLLYLGDNLIQSGVVQLVNRFNNENPDGLLLLSPVRNPSAFGIAELNPDGSIKNLEEKPESPKTNLAVTGIYLFKSRIFEAIASIRPSARGEIEIPDAIQWLIDNGGRVVQEQVSEGWKDTGSPEDLLEANKLLLDKAKLEIKGIVQGEVQGRAGIGEETVVEEGAKIIGPVIIGRKCFIGKGTFIGPYSSIGDNVKLQNANIEYSIILDNTTIETDKKIRNSIIGEKSEIRNKSGEYRLIIGDFSKIEL